MNWNTHVLSRLPVAESWCDLCGAHPEKNQKATQNLNCRQVVCCEAQDRRSLGAALDLTGARLPSAFLIGLQFEDFSLAPSNCVVRTHVLSISFLLTAGL
jgi:hypothetical protein